MQQDQGTPSQRHVHYCLHLSLHAYVTARSHVPKWILTLLAGSTPLPIFHQAAGTTSPGAISVELALPALLHGDDATRASISFQDEETLKVKSVDGCRVQQFT